MSFSIEQTAKGKPCIIVGKYKYRESYTSKNGDVTWRCLAKMCNASVKTDSARTAILHHEDSHNGSHPSTSRTVTLTPTSRRSAASPTVESFSPLVSQLMSKVSTRNASTETDELFLSSKDELVTRVQDLHRNQHGLVDKIQSLTAELEVANEVIKKLRLINNQHLRVEESVDDKEVRNVTTTSTQTDRPIKVTEMRATEAQTDPIIMPIPLLPDAIGNGPLCTCSASSGVSGHSELKSPNVNSKSLPGLARDLKVDKRQKKRTKNNCVKRKMSTSDLNSNTTTKADKVTWYHLADSDIETWFKHFLSIPEAAIVICPSTTQFIKMTDDSEALRKTCTDLHISQYQYIICVVNDREAELADGGSHWTLLVYHQDVGDFYHFDSIEGYNRRHAERLAGRLHPFLSDSGSGARVVEVACAQQVSSVECGAYVVHNARLVCSFIASASNICTSEAWLRDFSVNEVYGQIQSLRSGGAAVSQSCDGAVTRSADCVHGKLAVRSIELESDVVSDVLVKNKCKITVIGDSHVREMGVILGPLLPRFDVTAYCYPGAPMSFVIDNCNVCSTLNSEKSQGSLDNVTNGSGASVGLLSRADFIIVMAGTNNFPDNCSGMITSLSEFLKRHRNTNVIVMGIPRRFDDPGVNKCIDNVNRDFQVLVGHYDHATFIPLDSIPRSCYGRDGLHFNNRGKLRIVNLIVDAVCPSTSNEHISCSLTRKPKQN